METEKDHVKTDDKRVYRSPQLTEFGSIANTTQVQMAGDFNDNGTTPGFSMSTGNMGPMGEPVS